MQGGAGTGGWIAAAIAAVRDVERIAELGASRPAHRRHLWTGRTAIAESLLSRPAADWGERPFWFRYAGLFAGRGRIDQLLPRRLTWLETGIHADLLSFKSQIRGFYLDRPLTFKVSQPGSAASAGSVANEASIRGQLAGTEAIGVPKMLRHGVGGAGAYLVEELIADRERAARAALPEAAGAALFDFYRANRFALVPLREIVDVPGELAMLEAHARTFGFSLPDGTTDFVRDRFRNDPGASGGAMRSLLHGDLTPTNLLSLQRRLYLLDWEHGSVGMTFSDIARLCSVDAAIERSFLDAAGRWIDANDGRAMAPAHQLLVGAIVGVNRRIARGDHGGAAARSPESIRGYRRKAERFTRLIARLLRREQRAGAVASGAAL
jgi:hypothetical protein